MIFLKNVVEETNFKKLEFLFNYLSGDVLLYLTIFKTKMWDLKEELQHAYFKTKEQKEEIQNLQSTISKAKQELDQVVREKNNEIKVTPTFHYNRNS